MPGTIKVIDKGMTSRPLTGASIKAMTLGLQATMERIADLEAALKEIAATDSRGSQGIIQLEEAVSIAVEALKQ